MNNLKREFLYSDTNKYLPIQLIRTVNAVNELDVDVRSEIELATYSTLTIRVPYDSSCMGFLIEEGTSNIVEISIAPPGESSLKFDIASDDGRSFNIYIISKEYKDGWISDTDNIVDDLSSDRKSINYNPLPTIINLTAEGRMTLSFDENDLTQWYNFQGHYDKDDLIWWIDPILDGLDPDDEIAWRTLLYKKEIIGYLKELFKSLDLDRRFTDFDKQQIVKAFNCSTLIKQFIIKQKLNPPQNISDQLDEDIWNPLISSLENHIVNDWEELDNNLHEYVALVSAFFDIGCAWRWNHHQGTESNFVHHANYWYDMIPVIDAVENRGDHPYFSGKIYIPLYHLDSNLFGQMKSQILKIRNNNRPGKYSDGSTWDHIFYYSDGGGPSGGRMWNETYVRTLGNELWRTQGDYFHGGGKASHISPVPKDILIGEKYQERFSRANFDNRTSDGTDAIAWWAQIRNISQLFCQDVWNWIEDKEEEINAEILALRASIVQSDNGETPENGEPSPQPFIYANYFPYNYFLMESTPQPPTELDNIPFLHWDMLFRYVRNMVIQWKNQNRNPMELSLDPNQPPPVIIPIAEYWPTFVAWYNSELPTEIDGTIDVAGTSIGDLSDVTITDPTEGDLITWDDELGQWVNIREDGTSTPINPARTRTTGVAHEATLQNIRFLKNMLTAINENTWSTVTNSNSLIINKILTMEKDSTRKMNKTNMLNITSSYIDSSDIEVKYGRVSGGNIILNDIQEELIKVLPDGLILVNLNGEEFRNTGKYIVYVKPRKLMFNVESISDNILRVRTDETELDAYQDKNYFAGWNIQLLTPEGEKLGDQRIIIGSSHSTGRYLFKISPSLSEDKSNVRAEVWSNVFIPVVVDLDIVEHNALTLSYASYGKKEVNTNTGLCVIYDHLGNVYKRFSYGTYSDETTNGDIIEYRKPGN